MSITALDDAAWASPWRGHSCLAKVISTAVLTVAALALPAWPGSVIVALAAVAYIVGWARIPARVLGWAMLIPLVSIAVGAVSIMVVVGDSGGAQWGPFSVTRHSILRGLEVFGHAVAGSLAVFTLALTTPMVDILTLLRRARIPGPLLDLATLMYRLLYVVAASALALSSAYQRRHGDAPGLGFRRRWRNWGQLLTAVGMRTAVRATRLERGLDLRGDLDALETLPHPTRPFPALLVTTAAVVGVGGLASVVL
ncbi:cobalt ECF transporter T component CbiQ [Tessaracoccus massiliensis]|uniref:cobalt ECF transporter T component CbiQ n=1 Tax=Tessaracoccus massiliensis TaxID=1522311 RepID=UPI000590C92D|nr:cobalt ECF transporter T component CbiQ [Tessaracoccus massiliensis]